MNYRNGALPQSALAPITLAADGKQAYLRKDAAEAFMAMNEESERRFGVTLKATSPRAAYRSLADQQYFWDLYKRGQGNLAAQPGTSNHGLGLAIDLATQQMRDIVDRIGEPYGFAKKWSDAQSEWWHTKWREGNYKVVEEARWIDYTPSEKRWIQEYDRLVAAGKGRARRVVLRAVMTRQRQAIYRAAQKSGWNPKHRRNRYNSLKART